MDLELYVHVVDDDDDDDVARKDKSCKKHR